MFSWSRNQSTDFFMMESLVTNPFMHKIEKCSNILYKYVVFIFKVCLSIFLHYTWKVNGLKTEAVSWRCSIKEVFLETSQNSQESTCARVSFLVKFQDQACNFIKKEIGTGVFLWILRGLQEHLFSYKTPPMTASLKTEPTPIKEDSRNN